MKYAKIFVPILIILIILFVLFEKKPKEKEKGLFGTLGEYFLVDIQNVSKIELSKNDSFISISRSNGNWTMERPINTAADPKSVSDLLKNILDNPVHRVLGADEVKDVSEYGLDTEKETISLYNKDNLLLSLILGDNTITGSDIYVKKKGGNEVVLTAIQLRDNINWDFTHYRSRNPLNFDENSLVSIIFDYSDKRIRLEKDKSTYAWNITEPERFAAQNQKVNRFIGQLKRMEVVKFLNHRLPEDNNHGLSNPAEKVTLITDKNEVIEILVGETDVEANGFYARISTFPDEDFIIEASMLDKLKVTIDDLKETSLFQGNPTNVAKIDVREPKAENLSIFQDNSGKWKRLSPSGGDIDQKLLEEFFYRLRELRPKEYLSPEEMSQIDEEESGFDNYFLKIEIKCKRGCKDTVIIVGNEIEGKGYYARTSDMTNMAYIIDSELIDAFIKANSALKD